MRPFFGTHENMGETEMQKLFFSAVFVVAGCMLPVVPVHADAFSILHKTQVGAEQTVSVNNLSQLYLTVKNHLVSNRKYPTLRQLNLPPRVLANPYHALGTTQRVPNKITAANSGYAYLGETLNAFGTIPDAGSVPLAFEKPNIRTDNKVVVLYLDGKTKTVTVKARDCAGVVEALKREVKNPDAKIWNALKKAAASIDAAR